MFIAEPRAAEKQKGKGWVDVQAINRQPRWGFENNQFSILPLFGSWATGAGKDELFELGYASRDARADGAEGDLEDVRDFLIRRVVHVEQSQRGAKGFLD